MSWRGPRQASLSPNANHKLGAYSKLPWSHHFLPPESIAIHRTQASSRFRVHSSCITRGLSSEASIPEEILSKEKITSLKPYQVPTSPLSPGPLLQDTLRRGAISSSSTRGKPDLPILDVFRRIPPPHVCRSSACQGRGSLPCTAVPCSLKSTASATLSSLLRQPPSLKSHS